MASSCECSKGIPVILETLTRGALSVEARHFCSHCSSHLFDINLSPGQQLFATRKIKSCSGHYTVQEGQLLRITGFTDESHLGVGLIFSGLLAAGPFNFEGFSAKWDL